MNDVLFRLCILVSGLSFFLWIVILRHAPGPSWFIRSLLVGLFAVYSSFGFYAYRSYVVNEYRDALAEAKSIAPADAGIRRLSPD